MTAAVPDVGIDLGTTHTRVVLRGRGLALEVPTVLALAERTKGTEVVAFGEDALKLLGRLPEGTRVVRPIVEGRVADADGLEQLARTILFQVGSATVRRKPVVVAVSAPLSNDERAPFEAAFVAAGAPAVVLVPAPFAAAVGAGLPVNDPLGSLVVDAGGGRTHLIVTALGGAIVLRSVPVGGERVDGAISRWLLERHRLLVADRTVETLKTRVASAVRAEDSGLRMRIRGRDATDGRPRELEVGANDIATVLAEPLVALRRMVLEALREIPPELAGDIVDRGLLLTGGGGQLRGLGQLLGEDTGLPVLLAARPEYRVAAGLERMLDQPALLERIAIMD